MLEAFNCYSPVSYYAFDWEFRARQKSGAFFNMTTVALMDLTTGEFLIYLESVRSDPPFLVAIEVAEFYFDTHFANFAGPSARRFALFFRNPTVLAARVIIVVKVEKVEVTRSVIGDRRSGRTDVFPYSLNWETPENIEVKDFPEMPPNIRPSFREKKKLFQQ